MVGVLYCAVSGVLDQETVSPTLMLYLRKCRPPPKVDSICVRTQIESTFGGGLHFLKYNINVGDTVSWSKTPLTAQYKTPTIGDTTFVGTTTGSSHVDGFELKTMADGRFFPAALKITVDYSVTAT